MRLYRKLADFHGSSKGIALAIGNFDGFHLGHQAVVARMKEKACAMGLESAVMVFEPQPLEFFNKAVPARLFTLRDKLRIFKSAQIDNVFCMSFTHKFAALNDMQFVELLQDKLNVKSVTVGSLFNFGKGGMYKIDDLKRNCDHLGIECSAIEGVEKNGVRISSTYIRSLIREGDFEQASKFIGRSYSVSGRVVHGNEIGRTLGFPTANVNMHRRVCPLSGVYAVRIATPLGLFEGMANVGTRPTVDSSKTARSLLEVNIFNFNGDLYGREVEVFFEYKIRDERKFSSLNDLVDQLSKDKLTAIELLKEQTLLLDSHNVQRISSKVDPLVLDKALA